MFIIINKYFDDICYSINDNKTHQNFEELVRYLPNHRNKLICTYLIPNDIKFGNYLDERFFPKTGKCYDCSIIYDSKIKALGAFKEYEQYKFYNNLLSEMKDFKKNIAHSRSISKISFM